LVYATYSSATNTWSPAQRGPSVQYGDIRQTASKINSRGDFAILYQGFVRTAGSTQDFKTVLWKPAGAGAHQIKNFDVLYVYSSAHLTLDEAGNMLVAAELFQRFSVDIVAFRGTQSGGFGPVITIDNGPSEAQVIGAATSSSGKSIVVYRQWVSPFTFQLFVAQSNSAADAWVVTALGTTADTVAGWSPFVSDNNESRIVSPYRNLLIAEKAGRWSKFTIPTYPLGDYASKGFAFNRNGDFVAVSDTAYGPLRWISYDASRNRYIQAPIASTTVGSSSGFFFGSSELRSVVAAPLVALNIAGQAVSVGLAPYSSLPTASMPNGVVAPDETYLWSFTLN
jgi:hypothetical protein